MNKYEKMMEGMTIDRMAEILTQKKCNFCRDFGYCDKFRYFSCVKFEKEELMKELKKEVKE